jgi:hypothetical protein
MHEEVGANVLVRTGKAPNVPHVEPLAILLLEALQMDNILELLTPSIGLPCANDPKCAESQ